MIVPAMPEAAAAFTAEFGAETTMAILTNNSGRQASCKLSAMRGNALLMKIPGDKRHNETRFRSQADRPVDTELGLRVGVAAIWAFAPNM